MFENKGTWQQWLDVLAEERDDELWGDLQFGSGGVVKNGALHFIPTSFPLHFHGVHHGFQSQQRFCLLWRDLQRPQVMPQPGQASGAASRADLSPAVPCLPELSCEGDKTQPKLWKTEGIDLPRALDQLSAS